LTDPLRIVLVSPRNPLNIGAAARAMSNFGFTDMRLVKPYDVAFREARSAVKAGYILEKAQIHDSVAEAVAGCTLIAGTTALGHRDLHVPLYRLETAGRLIREHASTATAALLFGSEKFGLSNEDMSHCHWLTRIPTREEHGSMNLGQAVAVCLWELVRSEGMLKANAGPSTARPRRSAQDDTFSPAKAEEVERVVELLREVMRETEYNRRFPASCDESSVRRLVHRMGLEAKDAQAWMGILRQVMWKVGK